MCQSKALRKTLEALNMWIRLLAWWPPHWALPDFTVWSYFLWEGIPKSPPLHIAAGTLWAEQGKGAGRGLGDQTFISYLFLSLHHTPSPPNCTWNVQDQSSFYLICPEHKPAVFWVEWGRARKPGALDGNSGPVSHFQPPACLQLSVMLPGPEASRGFMELNSLFSFSIPCLHTLECSFFLLP